MRIAIGSDHAGFPLTEAVKVWRGQRLNAMQCRTKSHSFVASRTRVAGLALIVYITFSTSSERHT